MARRVRAAAVACCRVPPPAGRATIARRARGSAERPPASESHGTYTALPAEDAPRRVWLGRQRPPHHSIGREWPSPLDTTRIRQLHCEGPLPCEQPESFSILRDLVEERREDGRLLFEGCPIHARAVDDDRGKRECQARHLDSNLRRVVRADDERGVLRREPDASEAEAHCPRGQVAQHERAVLPSEPSGSTGTATLAMGCPLSRRTTRPTLVACCP